MEHTTTTSQSDGQLAGETLVIANPAKVVVVEGHYLNVEEIAFARNETSAPNIAGGNVNGPVPGCLIEFRRKGTVFVPGLSVEGLGSLVNNAPF
jgi:hypothetical protein